MKRRKASAGRYWSNCQVYCHGFLQTPRIWIHLMHSHTYMQFYRQKGTQTTSARSPTAVSRGIASGSTQLAVTAPGCVMHAAPWHQTNRRSQKRACAFELRRLQQAGEVQVPDHLAAERRQAEGVALGRVLRLRCGPRDHLNSHLACSRERCVVVLLRGTKHLDK